MSKTPFPFDEFCVVWSRQFGDKFSPANSPTDIPQSPFMINGAFSEVKISGKPTFKWKLISMTKCTAGAQALPFLPFPEVFTHFNPSPNQQITDRVLRDPEMREEALFFLCIITIAPVATSSAQALGLTVGPGSTPSRTGPFVRAW